MDVEAPPAAARHPVEQVRLTPRYDGQPGWRMRVPAAALPPGVGTFDLADALTLPDEVEVDIEGSELTLLGSNPRTQTASLVSVKQQIQELWNA